MRTSELYVDQYYKRHTHFNYNKKVQIERQRFVFTGIKRSAIKAVEILLIE